MSVSNTGATVRGDLRALVPGFINSEEMFVALDVMPLKVTEDEKFDYPKLNKKYLTELLVTRRGDEGGYSRSRIEIEWDNAEVEEDGHEIEIDEKKVRRYGSWFNAERTLARRATQILRRRMEYNVATLLQSSGSGGTWGVADQTITTAWATAATSTPMVDTRVAIEYIEDRVGVEPDVLVISNHVFRDLQLNAEIKSWIQYNNIPLGAGMLPNQEVIANALGIPNLVVAKGMYNTANVGQAASLSPLWSDGFALVGKVSRGDDLESAEGFGFGRTFNWAVDGPMGIIETYPEPQGRSEIVRARHNVAHIMLNLEAGRLIDITP